MVTFAQNDCGSVHVSIQHSALASQISPTFTTQVNFLMGAVPDKNIIIVQKTRFRCVRS